MDTPATSWFSDMGLEDPVVSDECDILDFLNEDLCAAPDEDFQCSLSPQCNSPASSTMIPRCSSTTSLCASSAIPDAPEQWPNSYNSLMIQDITNADINESSPTPMILSFENLSENIPEQVHVGMLNAENDAASGKLTSRGSYVNLEEATKMAPKIKKNSRAKAPSQTYDHIIAERKRREQLSRQFVALSTIVPGLKKTDKTSVLGDTVNYLKHLQEKVKTLEEQTTKRSMESVVLVKKSQVSHEDEGLSDEQGSSDEKIFPQIEAKVCHKNVLLRIQCLKHKGVLLKLLSVIQKFNLSVSNSNVTPFGCWALEITIIAEMEKECNLSTEDLIKSLQSALKSNRS